MATSLVRILVVDDFKLWRQQVCSILETRRDVRVVAQAADGLEAVQKAKELKPDLILLDIGVPNIDGLEAAHRICQLVPGTKIIFVTQNRDQDMVQAALSNGAQGYVVKTDAANELLPAVAAVLGGDHFLSRGVKEHHFSVETETT